MPLWKEILSQLSDLSAWPVFLALIVTSSVIVIVHDWRFGLWALLGQYVLVSILHLRSLVPELALLKLMVGVLICPMLYWAARWVEGERTHKAEIERQKLAEQGEVPLPPLPWPVRPTNWQFRLLAVILLAIVYYSVSRSFTLPFVDADIAPVCI